MNLTEAKKVCVTEIKRCFTVAEHRYGFTMPHVSIKWSNRMTRVGGNAKGSINKLTKTVSNLEITLSIPYLMGDMEEFINLVPTHEAAHIIDYVVNQSSGHGYSWQAIMRVLGKDPKRTHNMKCAVERKTRRTIEATCPCNTKFMLTPAKASRIPFLSCKKCRGDLRLVGAADNGDALAEMMLNLEAQVVHEALELQAMLG